MCKKIGAKIGEQIGDDLLCFVGPLLGRFWGRYWGTYLWRKNEEFVGDCFGGRFWDEYVFWGGEGVGSCLRQLLGRIIGPRWQDYGDCCRSARVDLAPRHFLPKIMFINALYLLTLPKSLKTKNKKTKSFVCTVWGGHLVLRICLP